MALFFAHACTILLRDFKPTASAIVNKRASARGVAAQRWRHLLSAPRMAQLCPGKKRQPFDVPPLEGHNATNNEDRILLQGAGFPGIEESLLVLRRREMQHATACQLRHSASENYNQGGFPVASMVRVF
ncbi:uncharacterized protein TrAFT101_011657 [Trichoderma asperellum]|uniref:uncharacterized protein n=1 Tax=Trichoderma asperellum TaxID=101201 RepID=UPI0033239FD9|nr:hypothetical protein TrAFT101_011657 [Trichoderma asperellum]